jgi:phosphoglycerol transferase
MTIGEPPDSSPVAVRDRVSPRRLVLEALLAAGLSVLCAAWVLRLWRGDLSVPLRYTPVDDTKFYLMLVKGIVDHGWYATNPSLGAPFGQQLVDYPQGADSISLLLIRFLALFSSNPALIINLFFLGTFALCAFTAHLVLRVIGLSSLSAGVAAVLFSLLAYHFFRGESHLFLSAYYAVPLTAYLFLRVLGGDPLFARRKSAGGRILGWASWRTSLTLLVCVVIGSDNLYYATFAVVMLIGAAVIGALVRRRALLIQGLTVAALIVATVTVNLAPSLVYRHRHGTNVTLERSFAENVSSNEAFALRISNLLLPAPGSRIKPLREATEEYDHAIAPGYCEACYASLGTVGDVGFIWLTLCALLALAGLWALTAAGRLLRDAAIGAWLALAVGAVGGLASLIELIFTADLRAWNRISVLIAFFSLFAAGTLLDALRRRLGLVRRGATIGLIALGAVLVFGVWDQTSDSYIPPYRATARQWRSDERFVREIEARLPSGAGVFVLPYVPFPEGYPETPVSDQVATYATKYEPLRGYLHSRHLRWSYGAIKGRAADWPAALAGQPLPYVLAAAGSAGFTGLWVDPAGFEPAVAVRLRKALLAILGESGLKSPDGDLWFYDLRPYLARLARSHSVPEAILLRRRSLYPLLSLCHRGGLELQNPGTAPVAATLRVRLAHPPTGHEVPVMSFPDGRVSEQTGTSPVTVLEQLTLAPGRTVIADPRSAGGATQVLYSSVTDDHLASYDIGPASSSSLVPGLTGPPCES